MLIVWITILNFFYLMTQMVVAIEDVSVRTGVRLASRFVWGHLREVAAVFGVVLLMVVIATVASILATAGLGLIAFVPLVGLAVLPLQFAAWLDARHRLRVPGAGRARRVPVALPLVSALPITGAAQGHDRPSGSHDHQPRSVLLRRRREHEGVGDPPDGRR